MPNGTSTPAERVDTACDRWGAPSVVAACAHLLTAGTAAPTGQPAEVAMVLGGVTDPAFLRTGRPPGHAYWARVWAARALLHVWSDEAAPAVIAALGDEQWRVREMAAKVVAAREIGEGVDELVALTADEVPRVRAAAAVALGAVAEGEHAAALRVLLDDPQPEVVRRAWLALEAMGGRLDRPL